MNKKDGSHTHHKPGEERTISGEVKVHGTIQIFETESAIQQPAAEREEDNTYKNAIRSHEGASLLTARITLVITSLYFAATGLIYWEAKRSADTANRSVQSFQDSQSARLVIEDFTPEITQGQPRQGAFITGNFIVTNVGPTVASEIYAVNESWGTINRPGSEPFPKLKPIPVANGPSIPPGKSRPYPIRVQEGNWEDVEKDKLFIGFEVAFSYRDIFGNARIVSDCFMYDLRRKQYSRCPVTMRETGFVPEDSKKQ